MDESPSEIILEFPCGCVVEQMQTWEEIVLLNDGTEYQNDVTKQYTVIRQCKVFRQDIEHSKPGLWGVFENLKHFPGAIVVAQL